MNSVNMETLNKFAEFIKYDKDQKSFTISFNGFSKDYEFNRCGKLIQTLLENYDPTGIFSIMLAKHTLLEYFNGSEISIYDLVFNDEVKEDIKKNKEMYDLLNTKEFLDKEKEILNNISRLIQSTSGKNLIENKKDANQELFYDAIYLVVDNIRKIKTDIYKKAGKINIENIDANIHIFERMSDCILWTNRIQDGMYLCYINQYGSSEGYFALMIKSNGTLMSVNDRVDESYIGQHGNSRNGRWQENKSPIFPYNSIFTYSDIDYKGYPKEYEINKDSLNITAFDDEAFYSIVIFMLMIKYKYDNTVPDGEIKYLNTLIKKNYDNEHVNEKGTELMVVDNDSIAVINNDFYNHINFDNFYQEQYKKGTSKNEDSFLYSPKGDFWIAMYGKGFKPDIEEILLSADKNEIKKINDAKTNEELSDKINHLYSDSDSKNPIYAEFIGDKDRIYDEIFYEIDNQLKRYIIKNMKKELEEFGGKEAVIKWWQEKSSKRFDKFVDMICEKYESIINAGETLEEHSVSYFPYREGGIHLIVKNNVYNYGESELNEVIYDNNGYKCYKCPVTGTKATIMFNLKFISYEKMEEFLGEPVPKVLKGYGLKNYNGNRLLDATRKTSEIKNILEDNCELDNDGNYKIDKWGRCESNSNYISSFEISLALSKRGLNKLYNNYKNKEPKNAKDTK